LNIKVEDIDKFYAGVLKTGLKPLSEPEDLPRGGKGFVMPDPDGHKLAFFD